MACQHWAGTGCPICDEQVGALRADDGPTVVDELRTLLVEWERFGRTMADAGVIALPERLLGRTVGLLDATSC